MSLRNLLLKIQYDGSNYHGYQIQPQAVTVQKVLEDTLSYITNEEIHVNGCSRTDARVHAVEYACSFFTSFPIPAERLPIVLNNKLPGDIRALNCFEVPQEFHARFDTVSKTYRYVINTDNNPQVFTRNYEWQIKKKLNTEAMREACKYLIGENDFTSFMTSGNEVKTAVRNVYNLDIKENNKNVEIYIRANGYLYNMVRIITGTLVDVGLNKYPPEKLGLILEAKDRSAAGPTAPPQGLALYYVEYGRSFSGKTQS